MKVFRSTQTIEEKKFVNPARIQLEELSKELNLSIFSEDFAKELDKRDKLKDFQNQFFKPEGCLYFTGNSLGLQPKSVKDKMNQELDKWKNVGVRGHFEGELPWFQIEEFVVDKLAQVVGAKSTEVAVMSTLTTNLHLLMVSFYQPTKKRFKILIEENPFPSDMMAMLSQLKYHGMDPKEALLQIGPREGEHFIHTEDILEIIEKEGDSIAVVLLSGVQFLSGQAFEMEKITKKGHEKGCFVGFDLAHAVGNLELKLNEWKVDFGCFCTYKYMNSGPGSIGGLFLHEMHHETDFKRFEGWWGNKRENRFSLKTYFDGQKGAGVYQLSNPSIFSLVPLLSSLEIFHNTSMKELRNKSETLTSYLEYLMENKIPECDCLTPKDPNLRGCQLSFQFPKHNIHELCSKLEEKNIEVDKREPNVMRVSPVPLYNSFMEVYQFVELLKQVVL